MRIAALAWGSLVWDRRNLAIAEDFRPNGPRISVEFCRVSGDGRLSLVIDEAVGTFCQTYSALSTHDDLDAALENLWIREGSKDERLPRHIRKSGRVGFVDVAAGEANATAIVCIDPAESAQVKPLMRMPQRGFSCPAPDAGDGGCRS